MPVHPPGLVPFLVFIEMDGNIHLVSSASLDTVTMADEFWKHNEFKDGSWVTEKAVRMSVWARDEEHAIKVAGDRRREYIESGKWKELTAHA